MVRGGACHGGGIIIVHVGDNDGGGIVCGGDGHGGGMVMVVVHVASSVSSYIYLYVGTYIRSVE